MEIQRCHSERRSSYNADAILSSRGLRAIQPPAMTYWGAFQAAKDRQWSKEDPDGNIIILVAENHLSADIVHKRLLECTPPTVDSLKYQDSNKGATFFREALARFASRTIMKGISVNPEHLHVQAGATPIIDTLSWIITEAGEGVLIPRPYYPTFDTDLKIRSETVPVPCDFDEGKDIGEQLTAAAEAAAAAGTPIRALLLTNPNNPLSTIYSRKTLVEALKWCLERDIHIISDELYALSVWGDGAEFKSLEVIAREEADQLPGGEAHVRQMVHVLFAFSKDMCASGMRFGILHTRSRHVSRAFTNLSVFTLTSAHMQQLMQQLLDDEVWMDFFLAENKRRLRHSYQVLSMGLKSAGIPFVEASAGFFCWINLQKGLALLAGKRSSEELNWDDEGAFWNELCKRGVLVTPGRPCHAVEPGFFRVCWAWVEAEALQAACERIQKFLAELEQRQQSQ